MADQERLTKAERREQARAERRAKEAEEAARAKRRRLTSIVAGVLIAAFVGWVLWLAFAGGPGDLGDEPRVIDPQAASDARETAGCVPMPADLTTESTHFAPAEAPPAEALYTLRPTASGPHFTQQAAPGVYSGGVEERAVTHSMEHGAVAIWFDPDKVDGDTVSAMGDWAELLNANGFAPNPASGAGIFVAPFEGAFTSGKAVALRAWGAALDCDSWETIIGDGFVVDNFGTHGIAPEAGALGRYPEGVMIFSPGADETEAPDGSPGFTPPASGDPSEDPSEQPTPDASADPSEEPTTDASPDPSPDASPDTSPEPTPSPS